VSFYEAMEKYYDDIFPLNESNLSFLVKSFANSGKAILDLACGTGSYALALASRGYIVTGVDLDETMIELALQKKSREPCGPKRGGEVSFFKGNMLYLSTILDHTYDGAFCIGNSLVHLTSISEIETAIKETSNLLRKGSIMVIQIVNYDRILKHHIKSLPTLENRERGVSFERLYTYDRQNHNIHFTGKLTLPDSSIRINTVPLYPLQKNELEKILDNAGFGEIMSYGNFAGEPWWEEAPALISKSELL